MKFSLSIECDNAAFCDEEGDQTRPALRLEIERICGKAAARIADGYTDGPLLDTNGNRVGSWELS